MTAEDWHPVSPERKRRARRALRDEYERWIAHGQLLLTPDGGWPPGLPASTGETWSAIVYLVAIASDRLGRYSHATRSVTPPPARAGVQLLAERAREAIERPAAAVIHALADQIDEAVLLSEASELVDEIADEDNGVVHASDGSAACCTPSSCALRTSTSYPTASGRARRFGSSRRCWRSPRACGEALTTRCPARS